MQATQICALLVGCFLCLNGISASVFWPVNPVQTVVEYKPVAYAPYAFPYYGGSTYYNYGLYNYPYAYSYGYPYAAAVAYPWAKERAAAAAAAKEKTAA